MKSLTLQNMSFLSWNMLGAQAFTVTLSPSLIEDLKNQMPKEYLNKFLKE
jgi:hypothetical protein